MQVAQKNREMEERKEDGRSLSLLSVLLALILYPLGLSGLKQMSSFLPQHVFEAPARVVTLRSEEITKILDQFKAPSVTPEVPKKDLIKTVAKKRPTTKKVPKTAELKEIKSEKVLLPSSWLPTKKALPSTSFQRPSTGDRPSETNLAFSPNETAGFGFKSGTEVLAGAKTESSTPNLFKVDESTPQVYDEKLVQTDLPSPDGVLIKNSKKEFEIRGGLDEEIIKGIVAQNLIELRYCYESLLLKDPSSQGDVMTIWQIDAEGTMTSIAFESELLGATELIPCMDSKMKLWKFPKPEGGGQVQVRYPFRFFR